MIKRIALASLLVALASGAAAQTAPYYPGRFDWQKHTPQQEGFDAAKLDATLLAVKLQEDAGIDIVSDGEQTRQHFVHGFLEFVDGIDFQRKVEIGIRADRYKAMVPTVIGPLELKGRVLDLIHEINGMRKDAGLDLTDRIAVTLPSDLADVMRHADWIKGETLAVSIDVDGGELSIRKVAGTGESATV